MNIRSRVTATAAAIMVAAFTFTVFPITADAGDSPWQLRITGLSMNPTGSSVFVPDSGERIPYSADNGYGFGIDLEYRASRRLGIDFGVLTATPVIDVLIDEVGVISASAKPRITPIYAGLNVHLSPDSRFDLYIGPLLAYVVYSSFDLVVDPWFLTEGFETRNDFGIGVNLGLDIRLGEGGWLLTAAFKYLDTTLEASPPDESIGRTDINPMIFSVGIGYRF
jgi:outer membrane protein W